MVKNLSAFQESRVWSLGGEEPLEKGMATHSSILAWRISWTEEPGGLQSMGSHRVAHDWATNAFTFKGFRGGAPLLINSNKLSPLNCRVSIPQMHYSLHRSVFMLNLCFLSLELSQTSPHFFLTRPSSLFSRTKTKSRKAAIYLSLIKKPRQFIQ